MKTSSSGSLWAIGGMAALVLGQKRTAVGLFARGVQQLETHWREMHPEFRGGLSARWSEAVKFYESTHQNQVNRYLHITGIPMIALGAAGLFAFKPLRPAWLASAGAFTAGWALNIVGHAAFEKKAPAFKDDPLSFIAARSGISRSCSENAANLRSQKLRKRARTSQRRSHRDPLRTTFRS